MGLYRMALVLHLDACSRLKLKSKQIRKNLQKNFILSARIINLHTAQQVRFMSSRVVSVDLSLLIIFCLPSCISFPKLCILWNWLSPWSLLGFSCLLASHWFNQWESSRRQKYIGRKKSEYFCMPSLLQFRGSSSHVSLCKSGFKFLWSLVPSTPPLSSLLLGIVTVSRCLHILLLICWLLAIP